ncbi:unnamed protein product [Rhizophagus irregularis]|uniref:MACPF domain-containing protein n=1 Tax=Rhizophagus irregularis TaxID=588596 RepID=A0A915ZSI5_9GLOM|nr:unnamed protein product [Rhizophagus irregularis]
MSFLIDSNAIVTVKTIVDPSSYPPPSAKTVRLNLENNLSIIRQELKDKKFIDNTLLFSTKYREDNNNDNINYGFSEIKLEEEESYLLNEVIVTIDENNILYLKQCSEPDWKCLNKLRKLDYGCTMTSNGISKADKRAFEIEDCELFKIGAEGCRKGIVESKSNNDRIMKKNLIFSTDLNLESLGKLGISIGNMENKEVNSENIYSYHFTEYGKVSLKFGDHLKPTQEFIKEVKKAINSVDPAKKFKQITEQYGQFIPTTVILGGRVHYDERVTSTGCSTENSKEASIKANAGNMLEVNAAGTSGYSKAKSNHYKSNYTKLIGGEQSDLGNFDEKAWFKSLENYKNWDCIELQGLISIFQPIPDDLRKNIIESVGKRIHHLDFGEFNYCLEEPSKPKIFEFNIPTDISDIIQNKEADCNVFATVIDMEKSENDCFTCQVLRPPGGIPSLIVHCIQKKFKKRQCKLKIIWMVIGYYIDFNFIISDFNTQLKILKNENTSDGQTMINTAELLNFEYNPYISKIPPCIGIPVLTKLDSSNDSFIIGHHFLNAQKNKTSVCTFSYNLKDSIYDKLPDFTFCTLIISNYNISSAYDIISFDRSFSRKKKLYIKRSNLFISLYSTLETNCGPIFLKQNYEKIRTKSIKCGCKCKVKPLEISGNNIKCAFFDPNDRIKE